MTFLQAQSTSPSGDVIIGRDRTSTKLAGIVMTFATAVLIRNSVVLIGDSVVRIGASVVLSRGTFVLTGGRTSPVDESVL